MFCFFFLKVTSGLGFLNFFLLILDVPLAFYLLKMTSGVCCMQNSNFSFLEEDSLVD